MDTVKEIPALKKGDLVHIVAPAKAIETTHITFAKEKLERAGYRVEIGKNCLGQFNYFSGTDAERTADFQEAMDNPEVKAIFCARGGYGCVRILDRLQWAGFIRNPKWIVGFSDVTVFHQRIQKLELPSIHATMPLNFSTNTEASFSTLFDALEDKTYSINFPTHQQSKKGQANGTLVGGNLSILYSLLGTDDQIEFQSCILFIEDLAEQLYHLDRMFFALEKAGILNKIKGLIIGGMTNFQDTENPFGQSVNEIVLSHFPYTNIPIAFDCPAGHIDDNRALVFGKEVSLTVDDEKSVIQF